MLNQAPLGDVANRFTIGARMLATSRTRAYYRLSAMYFGVPCKLGATGLERIIEVELSDDEQAALRQSADAVKQAMEAVRL